MSHVVPGDQGGDTGGSCLWTCPGGDPLRQEVRGVGDHPSSHTRSSSGEGVGGEPWGAGGPAQGSRGCLPCVPARTHVFPAEGACPDTCRWASWELLPGVPFSLLLSCRVWRAVLFPDTHKV